MNLFDMHRRADPRLTIDGPVKANKTTHDGRVYRGFELGPGATLSIDAPLQCHPFREFRRDVGWRAWKQSNDGRLVARYLASDTPIGLTLALGKDTPAMTSQTVEIPYPLYRDHDRGCARLELRCESGRVFLAVNEANDRSSLVGLCVGTGFEIGPGHQPQILPSQQVDVRYLEEKSRDEWLATYNREGKIAVDTSHWDRYRVGTAAEIPADAESLDFIFCSHLFEHLANPLGHLEYWSGKLRRGGRVACVIPDIAGSKDYVFAPSSPAEWMAEYEHSSTRASKAQFARYAKGRNMLAKLPEMMETGYSIHVHFYEPSNLSLLLTEALARGWYADYAIDHRPNNKDFYFWLTR
ncbi:MAG: methyltransferase domain-containing protein [Burkholderiaceae bacterium]